MSLATRKELLKHVKERYKKANWKEKSKILDDHASQRVRVWLLCK